MSDLLIPVSFFLIAAIYSSAGFGGGSSYLAILALTGMNYLGIRTIALLCNVAVVGTGSLVELFNGKMNLKEILPYVILSIPMAALGGITILPKRAFFIMLGLTLFASVVCMLFKKVRLAENSSFSEKMISGGFIGYISGLAGIGGGIFLAPFLYLKGSDESSKIATCTTVFILVNSFAALAGICYTGNFRPGEILSAAPLLIAVVAGALSGSLIRLKKISPKALKKISASLILLVSMKLLKEHLFI